MIDRVLIQKQNGEFVTPNGYSAWKGFDSRGFPITFFDWPSLRDGAIAAEASSLVVGGAGAVIHVLRKFEIKIPTIDDLPDALATFRGRNIWRSTLGEIRGQPDCERSPVFIKPLADPKIFRAQVIRVFRDLIPTVHLADEVAVLVSDPINFVSEWRFFVLDGKVVGTGFYFGDPLLFPDAKVVSGAVEAWKTTAPIAYGIDFGVTADGRSLLVEVNDAYSLGCLGLSPVVYSQMLEARWNELLTSANHKTT